MDNAGRAAASMFARPISGEPVNDSTVLEGTLRQRRVAVQSTVQPRPGSNSLQAGQVGGGNRRRVPVSHTATVVRPLAHRLEVAEPGHFPLPQEAASLHARRANTRSVDSPSPLALSQRPLTPRHPLPLSVPPPRRPPTPQPCAPPLQPESPRIASIAALPGGSDASPAAGAESPPPFTKIRLRPWLSREDDMACRQMDEKLRQVLDRPRGSMPPNRDDLSAAVSLLAQVERDVIEIDTLLKKHRQAPLCAGEWRVLSQLIFRYEDQNSWLNAGSISRLAQWEYMRSRFGDLSLKLRQRVAAPFDYLNSCDVAHALQRTAAELPIGEGKQVVVHSCVTPGTALGWHFAARFPFAESLGREWPPYEHAPGLAQTSLINRSGQLLYSGLRNCPFQPISARKLILQTDDEKCILTNLELGVMGGRVHDVGGRRVVGDRLHGWQTELTMKQDPRIKTFAHALMWKHYAQHHVSILERDLLAAALAADPEKLSEAIDGKTVSLGLCIIQTAKKSRALQLVKWLMGSCQSTVLRGLHRQQGAPVPVCVRGVDRRVRSVPVVVQIREFLVLNNGASLGGITTGPESASGCLPEQGASGNTPAAGWTTASSVERLLGPADSSKLGGDAESRHVAMQARLRRKRAEVGELERQYRQSCLDPGGSHPACSELLVRIENVRQEAATIEKNARTLVEAGEQVKELLASLEPSLHTFPIPEENMVASRLALVGHLMGETLLLPCVDSKFAARLDAEVKFLATVADNNEGHLPPLHERRDTWRSARDQFRAGLAPQAGDFWGVDSGRRVFGTNAFGGTAVPL